LATFLLVSAETFAQADVFSLLAVFSLSRHICGHRVPVNDLYCC
jgi:hypothetical protein